MKIIVNEKEGTFTFIPVEKNESKTLVEMARRLSLGEILGYGGRTDEPDGSINLQLFAGGRRVRKVARKGRLKISYPTIVGGCPLILRGTEHEDRCLVWLIRDVFQATPGLAFVWTETIEGKVCLVFSTEIKCKFCETPICYGGGLITQICDSCSEKCNHVYEKSIVQLESGELGIGQRCSVCLSEKPKDENEAELSVRVQQAMIEVGLGLKIFTSDEDLVKAIKRKIEK